MTFSALAATAGAILFPLGMVYAGLMDLVTLKIRNLLVLALAAAWIVLAPLAGFSPAELGLSLALALFTLTLSFTFFALGWIGGGDAKLAAVTALWFGPDHALAFFIYSAVFGGLLTVAVLQFRARLLPAALYRVSWIAGLHDSKTGIPYGAAMAPAALILFPNTAWLAQAVA